MFTNLSFATIEPWLYWALIIAYIITVVSIIGIVLSENRNPVKSLAWVSVLLMFPIGGLILYLFFGRSIKNKRMISRRNKRKLRKLELQDYQNTPFDGFSPTRRQQLELGKALDSASIYPGNISRIFFNGKDKLNSLLADIENAQHFINLQYYIFEDDNTGKLLADALIRKAAQGVKIRIIYDHIGSIHVSNSFFRKLRNAGIEVYPFFRVVFPLFATRINWRNHRKICIIDGKIGYVGGMNIADRYIDGGKFKKWRDTHMRIDGPAVNALQLSFAIDWNFMGQPLIEEPVAPVNHSDNPDSSHMQFITSGPTSEWSNVEFQMLQAISNAKSRIFIQTPYFLPTESLLRALQSAALSRVDVRVMIPRASDSKILTYASRSYIYESLRAGIKIYLYDAGMLHAKTMIVDRDFSAIGSANIDFRSFEHNFEGTMFIYSSKVNSILRHQFLLDEQECTRIKEAEWRVRPYTHKAFESILRLLSPIL